MSTPHKCPVCEGEGCIETQRPPGSEFRNCKPCCACGRTGIVWESGFWMEKLRSWANSHPQGFHRIDDSRETIYGG